jgi:hypothetical protein
MNGMSNRYGGEEILVGARRVNGEDEVEEIWLMGFIYIYEIE